jgi:SPP1 family predicted phage head-tail adaptor
MNKTVTGKYRHKVTIQQKGTTRDTDGSIIEGWANLTSNPTVYDQIRPLNTREIFQAQQFYADANFEIVMRYRNDINETMRVIYGDRVFEIKGLPINQDERNRELRLMCREVPV